MIDFLLWRSDAYMPLLTLLLYLCLWNRIGRKELVLFYYLILNVLLFTYSNYLGSKSINNLYIYHVFTAIDLCFATYIIAKASTKKSFSRQFVLISVLGVMFCIVDEIFWEPYYVFNSIASGVCYLIIMVYAMYYLLSLSKSDAILHFQDLPSFWYVSAFLVYCSISFLVAISYKYFVSHNLMTEAANITKVYMVAIIIKFAMICIGLLCYRRPYTQTQ